MRITDFALERYFARWEFAVEHVLCASDVEGWSSEDVRNALDLSETNQRVLLHRARSKVRAALESYLGGKP